MEVTRDTVVRWLESYARDLESNREYLTDLDGPIGDNDHGINMDRGFRSVVASLAAGGEQSIEAVLKTSGMMLIRTVGGAAGPLYGTVFLRMAQAAAGKERLDGHDLADALEAGWKGIVDRGRAEPGDKTMLDTWEPAVRAYRDALEGGTDPREALRTATRVAEDGMRATIPMVARKGRASYLGERSAGHQDPGATSCYLLFKNLAQAVDETNG